MKFNKISMLVAAAGIFATTSTVFAKNEDAGQELPVMAASPAGNTVGNQNQVKTQNMGEDSMIQVKTIEKENLGTFVSQKVQELLDDESLEKGIGQQLKEQIQEHKMIQEQVQSNLESSMKRSKAMKTLIGPDYKALKNAKSQLEQNQMRIKNLEELKLQLTNKSDITMVTETIQALVEQNTALQDQISTEESSKSLFGWLLKIFAK